MAVRGSLNMLISRMENIERSFFTDDSLFSRLFYDACRCSLRTAAVPSLSVFLSVCLLVQKCRRYLSRY